MASSLQKQLCRMGKGSESIVTLFTCPVCGKPLNREEKWYECPSGHHFDRASAGYVHLLPVQRKHSKTPGDSKEMALARNRFLSGGCYGPLLEELSALALAYTGEKAVVLDSGCGEGYYTAGVYQALRAEGRDVQMAGIDLSKFSLRWAAKRERAVEFAVASAYHLPLGDGTVDLVINCFSPLGLEEFRRVMKEGAVFLYVVPAPRHLWELKQVLYDVPYENREERIEYEGFSYEEIRSVSARIHLDNQQTIFDLFQMTPYYWRTPKAGVERLKALDALDLQIAFHIHVFRKNKETQEDAKWSLAD